MKIIHAAGELKSGRKTVCLAMGFFDGVHLGHQQLIRRTVSDARQNDGVAVVLTFDRHPNNVVAPARVPPLIYSLPQKLRAIACLGPQVLFLIRFDKAFSMQSGAEFIENLVRDFGRVQTICVGADFVFGHRRSGNVALLERLGARLDFRVHGLAAVSLDGQMVSSTRIREAIRRGHFDAASQMLGRPYTISGRVLHGDKIGRDLGFPTANLDVKGLVLPPKGVYAASTVIKGRAYRVGLNIGSRPTIAAASEIRVEAHVLGYSGDLYDAELEVEPGEKVRDERQFDSIIGLKAQISKDIAAIEKPGKPHC
ncbi:MAG: bifunctional riboflavin kinase/FAD synthetase [Verrucomicrobiota bacterium]|nr:bifunctional riboflavin kinase/FAD synthetase [Verrucomicrobiota bacterium]